MAYQSRKLPGDYINHSVEYFLDCDILLPKDIWIEIGTVQNEIVSEDEGRITDDRTFTEDDPKGDRR